MRRGEPQSRGPSNAGSLACNLFDFSPLSASEHLTSFCANIILLCGLTATVLLSQLFMAIYPQFPMLQGQRAMPQSTCRPTFAMVGESPDLMFERLDLVRHDGWCCGSWPLTLLRHENHPITFGLRYVYPS